MNSFAASRRAVIAITVGLVQNVQFNIRCNSDKMLHTCIMGMIVSFFRIFYRQQSIHDAQNMFHVQSMIIVNITKEAISTWAAELNEFCCVLLMCQNICLSGVLSS